MIERPPSGGLFFLAAMPRRTIAVLLLAPAAVLCQPDIRVNVDLAQIEAVVTDAKGRHAPGLGVEVDEDALTRYRMEPPHKKPAPRILLTVAQARFHSRIGPHPGVAIVRSARKIGKPKQQAARRRLAGHRSFGRRQRPLHVAAIRDQFGATHREYRRQRRAIFGQ